MSGQVISVNIGEIREVDHGGRTVTTGIFKRPTAEPQRVEGVHIGADKQADTQAHGGVDKAIYAYADEDYDWWVNQLGRELEPGGFGENLTVRGIDVSGAKIGDRWTIGTTILEVSEPRVPCFKLGIRSGGIPRIQQTFGKADRPGTYLRIAQPGELTVGDSIEVQPTAAPSVTVADIAVIYHRDRNSAATLLEVPGLSVAWQQWAADAVDSTA